jgi:hypothetical protein
MAVRAPRRGLKVDFDPNKLVEGELAMPLDTKELYVAFSPGDVQKLATHENVKEMVEEATEEVIADFTEGVNNATEYATEQGDYAKAQGNHAKTQGDYAKEQGDYAKAQGQAAESIVLGNIATETTPGIVRGGGDVKVDPVTGDMTAPDKLDKTGDSKNNTVTFEQATEDGELTSGSTHATLFGLIKKKFADILTALAYKIDKTSIAQTTEVNDSTKVPSTAVTHGMQQNIVKNANDINALNNKLVKYKSIELLTFFDVPANTRKELYDISTDITLKDRFILNVQATYFIPYSSNNFIYSIYYNGADQKIYFISSAAQQYKLIIRVLYV